MQDDDSQEVTNLFSKKNLPSIFGPETFITKIREKYYFIKTDCMFLVNPSQQKPRFLSAAFKNYIASPPGGGGGGGGVPDFGFFGKERPLPFFLANI